MPLDRDTMGEYMDYISNLSQTWLSRALWQEIWWSLHFKSSCEWLGRGRVVMMSRFGGNLVSDLGCYAWWWNVWRKIRLSFQSTQKKICRGVWWMDVDVDFDVDADVHIDNELKNENNDESNYDDHWRTIKLTMTLTVDQ